MPYIIEDLRQARPPGRAPAAARRAPGIPGRQQGPAAGLRRQLQDDGADAGGGLYLVDLDTREAAQQFIDADPFAQAGLFERVAITRWRKAYVDGVCHL